MNAFDEIPMGSVADDFLAGGGATGARLRAMDWSNTPLGPVESWPQSLKIVIRIMLNSRFAMWMAWGPELTFFCNDAYWPTLGMKQPWALGTPAPKVWEEIWPDISPRIRKVIDTGEATWDEALLLFLERSGYPEETYHTFSYSPVSGDDGAIAGMLCVVSEETERVIGDRRLGLLRSVATALTATQTREDLGDALRRSIEADPRDLPFTLTYLFDSEGHSARLACATGIPPGHPAAPAFLGPGTENPPWPIDKMLEGQANSVVIDDLAARFQNLPVGPSDRSPRQAIAVPLAQQGLDRPAGFLIAALNPFREFDASYRGFVGLLAGQVASGLANARAYEEERRRAESLAELDRAKTTFFSNVSHEFRTPLTLMLGPIEEALAEEKGTPQRVRLEVLHRNALRLQKLVNSLLDFSRIQAGRIRASFVPTDLPALTAELASVFRSAVEKAGMRLAVDCPPLPEPVYVDREMWEKIVLNLVSNAFKFTLDGEIGVTVQPAGRFARLIVRDTGTGISQDQLPHIFERFHRVEGARARTQEGTGIGLALVQELVKLHEGTIVVESVHGKGTIVTVEIPFGRGHLPRDQIGVASPASPTNAATGYAEQALLWLPDIAEADTGSPSPVALRATGVLHGTGEGSARPRILLADDNADMRNYVRSLLQARYDVEAVADGAAALAAARRNLPDLILTDVMMPRLDGFGLIAALREDIATASVPVIMLSARAGEEARVEGLEAGADDYLIKPFGARELIARVGSLLELARVRRLAAFREQQLLAEANRVRQRLETVLTALSDPFFSLDRDWRYVYVNDSVVQAFGLSRERFLGETIWDVFPQAVGTSFEAELRRAVEQNVSSQFEYYYPPLERWFDNRAYPSAEGVSLLVTDITARKTAEIQQRLLDELSEAVRNIASADEVLRTVVYKVGEYFHASRCSYAEIDNEQELIIVLKDHTHGMREVPGVYSLREFGSVALEELRGGRNVVLDDAHADERTSRDAALALDAIDVRAMICIPLVKEGRLVATFSLQDKSPRTWSAAEIALAEQIAERTWSAVENAKSQKQVRDSEERYRILTEVSPQIVWMGKPDGAIGYCNQRWYDYSGLTPEETLGEGWTRAIQPEYRERIRAFWLTSARSADGYEIEIPFRRASDETYRWHLTRGLPIQDEAGKVAKWVGVAVDIHDRKVAEEDRERLLNATAEAKAEAEAANRMKDEFLATLSHELRTPLNAILGWASILRTGKLGPSEVAEAIDVIERNSKSQAQLINDLLDISRIISGKLALEVRRVSLHEIIEAAVNTVMPAATAKGVRIEKILDSLAGPISGDPTRLQQVVWNLVANAVKFTPKGGRVQVLLERVNSHVELSVVDTGQGIKPEFLPHIFERFRQADASTTRRYGGLGLGLSIVKQLTEMHGGTVRAKSPGEGEGATFIVMLPILIVHAEPVTVRPKALGDEGLEFEERLLAGIRVLVVDDEPDARQLVRRILAGCQAEVAIAGSVAEAIEILGRFKPDVLISDIGMPEEDGYDLLRKVRLRHSARELPAAALTAFARPEDRKRALLAGFQTHVAKPVDPDELTAVVATLAGRTGNS